MIEELKILKHHRVTEPALEGQRQTSYYVRKLAPILSNHSH